MMSKAAEILNEGVAEIIKDAQPKRCSGHCCKRFSLPVGYETLKRSYESWKTGGGQALEMTNRPHWDYRHTYQEIHLIFPMVIPLGKSNVDCATGEQLADDQNQYHYRCKHLAENGDCTIYDNRPTMCSSYPYGRECRYIGCTADYPKDPPVGIDTISKLPDKDPRPEDALELKPEVGEK